MNENTVNGDQHSADFLLAQPPSYNYGTARGTLVYRLSELVFGSLLAAYILGFISFAANALLDSNTSTFVDYYQLNFGFALALVQVFTYAFISCTYAYLTAAIYLQYHMGILTMPTAAVERSRFDFSIAMLEALLFGISMLIPQLFFLCVAIALGIMAFRQQWEFRSLVRYFCDEIQQRRKPQYKTVDPKTISMRSEAERSFYDEVRKTIAESKLRGWNPVSKKNYIGIPLLAFTGICLLAFPSFLADYKSTVTLLHIIYACASFVLFLLILISALETMKAGSRFIHDRDVLINLDQEYLELESKLRRFT